MGNETATAQVSKNVHFDTPMQDIANTLEERLYGAETPAGDEAGEQGQPTGAEEDEVLEDEETLPKDDDSDSDEDEGGKDLDDIAGDEDLSLADYLGVDDERIVADDDGNIMLNTIVDGETTAVPIKDVVASYQLQGHVNNKSIALETERKEFDETRTQVATELKSRIDGVTNLGKVLEKQLLDEYNSIDWESLRRSDPAEWTALRQDYAEKAGSIKQAQDLAGQESTRLQQEHATQMQEKMGAHLKSELGKMIGDNPTWADEAIRHEAQGKLSKFVVDTYGYSTEELASVGDHRLVRMMHDAKAYREGKEGAAAKKESRVPKFRKPGASKKQGAALAKARGVKAKRAAVKKGGGHTSDVANLILDRM